MASKWHSHTPEEMAQPSETWSREPGFWGHKPALLPTFGVTVGNDLMCVPQSSSIRWDITSMCLEVITKELDQLISI